MLEAPAPDALDIFQIHPVATLLIAGDGKILDANQAAEALLNRAQPSLIGRSASSALGTDDGALHRLLGSDAGTVRLYAIDVAPSGAAVLPCDLILGAAYGDGGARALAVHPLPIVNRTGTNRPGAAARSATAAAAMLAHEIKNPLSGIRGAAQLLGRGAGPTGADLSRLIVGEVDRIAALIDSMQGFTRDAPQPSQRLNIYPALAQARSISAMGSARRVRIVEHYDPSLPDTMGNHDSLVQILINLIKNASEALTDHADPVIQLSTAYRQGLAWDDGGGQGAVALPVEIAVLDNGPGIHPSLTDALFDPFVSGRRDGQGLGLALVDKLMRDMGGMVQHDRIDGWTRFRLHFAVASSAG
jgi:two-component system, NtrC family, nitrogen regulation sensor histidine kinase GlnL